MDLDLPLPLLLPPKDTKISQDSQEQNGKDSQKE